MLDVVLAIVHHLLIFAIAALLTAQIVLIAPGLSAAGLQRAAAIDRFYGVLAGLILIVGFSRAIYAAKGWEYYSVNLFFWAKIAAFAVVGLLSILPTLRLVVWTKAERQAPGALPASDDLARVRRVLWLEAAVFASLPVFAALMARGYGQL
jgi:putative membrane protein